MAANSLKQLAVRLDWSTKDVDGDTELERTQNLEESVARSYFAVRYFSRAGDGRDRMVDAQIREHLFRRLERREADHQLQSKLLICEVRTLPEFFTTGTK